MGLPRWQQAFFWRHRLPEAYLPYAQQWFMPLAKRLAGHQIGAGRPVPTALRGSQSSGKTTTFDCLHRYLELQPAPRVLSLSIVDSYQLDGEYQVTSHRHGEGLGYE